MITVSDLPFVAYPVTDKQRARDFYEGLLGLKEESGTDFPDGFWIEYALGHATLAITSYWKPAAEPAMGPAVAFEVEDYDGTVALLREKGVRFAKETLETPVCHLCIVLDPDGNSLFIHKRKPGRA